MKRLLAAWVWLCVLWISPTQARAQRLRDSTAFLPLFQPRIDPSFPADYIPILPGATTGGGSGLPYLWLSNSFRFDTTNTKSVAWSQSLIGTTGVSDPCFNEMRATFGTKGLSTASCNSVYVPTLPAQSPSALDIFGLSNFVRNASGQFNSTEAGSFNACRVVAANGGCWGDIGFMSDTVGQVAGFLIGSEAQVSPLNTAAAYTTANSTLIGFQAVISGVPSQAFGNAFLASRQPPNGFIWSGAFVSNDSGAQSFGVAGTLGTGANSPSQPLAMCQRNGANVRTCGDVLHYDQFGNEVLGTVIPAQPNTNVISLIHGDVLANGVAYLSTQQALTCGAGTSITIEVRTGNYFTCNITANVAAVLQVPTANPSAGTSQRIVIAFRNSSGGALTTAPTFVTTAGGYKFGATACNPTNGTQCQWTFDFDPVQVFWYLASQTGPF